MSQAGATPLDGGAGLALFAGARFDEMFGLQLAVTRSSHETGAVDATAARSGLMSVAMSSRAVIEGFTINAQLHAARANRDHDPYVQVGIGAFWVGDVSRGVGRGLEVGIGYAVRVLPSWSVRLEALYRAIDVPLNGTSAMSQWLTTAVAGASVVASF